MKRIIANLFLIAVTASVVNGQVTLQHVLDSISVNNLQIKASLQNRDAEIISAHTGLTPDNPQVEYGYFPGNNDLIGNKSTLNVSQSFYFPTVYLHKKAGEKLQEGKSEEVHQVNKREILIEAAVHYLELTYFDRYSAELKKRMDDSEEVKRLFEKRLLSGDANQIELNKVRMEASRWKNEYTLNLARKAEQVQILTAMNCGKPIAIETPAYPVWQLLPVDSILAQAVRNDPVLKALNYDQQMAGNKVKLQQALWLPQFKAGYGQETILDGSYRGVQAGISIPLWQNKNAVKSARSQQQATEGMLEAYAQHLKSRISAKYQLVSSLRDNVEENKKVIEWVQSQELLRKSMLSGNISVLEYYRELASWYESNDRYLVSAKDYYLELVYLMQYEW